MSLAIGVYLIYLRENALIFVGFKKNSILLKHPLGKFMAWYVLLSILISLLTGGVVLILKSIGFFQVFP